MGIEKSKRLQARDEGTFRGEDVWGPGDSLVLFQGDKGITKDLSNLTEAGRYSSVYVRESYRGGL